MENGMEMNIEIQSKIDKILKTFLKGIRDKEFDGYKNILLEEFPDWDSLVKLKILMAVEQDFGISVDDVDFVTAIQLCAVVTEVKK
jgi:acyl carrier protein